MFGIVFDGFYKLLKLYNCLPYLISRISMESGMSVDTSSFVVMETEAGHHVDTFDSDLEQETSRDMLHSEE